MDLRTIPFLHGSGLGCLWHVRVGIEEWTSSCRQQGDHSPDNVKFPDGSRHSSTALGMLSVTHIKPVLVLIICMDANMQSAINSFRQLFPDF